MASLSVYASIGGFLLLQLMVTGYAVARGGAPERVAGVTLLFAAIITLVAPLVIGVDFNHVAWALFLVDGPLLILLMTLAVFADRYWPVWLAALQMVAIGNHGVRAYDPIVLGYAYWFMAGKVSYPMLMIVAVGTMRHKRRLREGLPEYAWTYQRMRSWRQRDKPTPDIPTTFDNSQKKH